MATEAPNSLVSDSLLKVQDLLCEGLLAGFVSGSGIYGADPLTATYFNDVVVRNLDGSYNFNVSGAGFQFSWVFGTTGQAPMSGYQKVVAQVPLPQDSQITYPPTNAGLPKSLLVTFNTQQYPDANAILVSYRIPAMYVVDSSNGNVNGFEIDVQASCSLNNGPFVPLDNGSAFIGKNTTPYFRTYQYTLPITTPAQSFYQWTLKFSKTNQDVESTNVADDIFVDSIAVVSASQYNYPNSAMVGLYIDALQFGTVPSRSYLMNGLLINVPSGYTPTQYTPTGIVAAVYPSVWNGTFQTGVWTNNPAWIFYDFVTNPRYGLGQYINTNNMDIWTLYQISQYCDQMVDNGLGNSGVEPQFACNVYIKEPEDAYNMLLNMASVFRGMLYYGNGTIRQVTTDNKSPVFNYTNANVVNGVFNYSSTARSARHNAVQVKYVDPLNLYRENYLLIEDAQGIIQYGYNKKDISAFGCTSLGQATRVANWILTTERLRTETVSFQAGYDNLYLRPGDVFNLYDNFRMNKSQGGRVTSFDTGEQFITLDRPVTLDSGCIYSLTCLVPAANFDATGDVTGSNQIGLIRNPQIQSCLVLNANLSGLTTLQVSGGFSGLSKNAVWVLSCSGVYTANYVPTVFEQAPQYECLSINQSAPGVFDVTAINYNTGINYTVNTGFSAVMNPVNSGDLAIPLPVTNFTGSYVTGILSNNSFYQYFNLTWSASLSPNVDYYAISGDATATGTAAFVQIGTSTTTGFSYISPNTGNADFKCVAVAKGGGRSAAQSTSFTFAAVPSVDTNQIRFWMLPAGFGDLEQIGVFYNRPSQAVTNTRIFYATGAGKPFREVLDQSFYPVEGVSLSGFSTSGTTAYFSASSFDTQITMTGQGPAAQASNTLLFLVDNELMSIGPVTGYGVNQYAMGLSRGVLGTSITTHTANTTGWVFYSADLNSFADQSLVSVFNNTGYSTGVATRYFQIQNETSVLDGAIVPASPGIAYVLPNPTPNAPTSLVATAPGGTIIHLSWTASTSIDVIQYNIYRAVSPFTTFTLVGSESSNTFFDDTSVTIGTTYEYYVTTVAQNEQQSPQSNTVTITPAAVPTGANLTPPSTPTAPTLSSSGYYNAADGTVLIDFIFNISALPNGAIGQYLLYGLTGSTILMVANDAQNSGSSTTVKLNDLTPGQYYNVATQAYSPYGVLSQIATGNGGGPFNSWLVPSKTVFIRANPPSNVQIGAAFTTSPVVPPPRYLYSTSPAALCSASTGSWTSSPDNDIAFYEFYYNATSSPPSDGAAVNYANTVPASQTTSVWYSVNNDPTTYSTWVRAINKSGGTSTWTQSVNNSISNSNYAGTLGGQNYNSTQLTQVQIGPTAVSSVSKTIVSAYIPYGFVLTGFVGSAPNANVNVDISPYGFNVAPDVGIVNLSAATHGASYRVGNAANSSTNAVISIFSYSGSSDLVSGETFTGTLHFQEHA